MAQLEPELRGIFCEFLVRLTHGYVFFLFIFWLRHAAYGILTP